MKFKILVENKTDSSLVKAEHGLAVYIETQGKKILFDSGASELLIKNAEAMGVDLENVDFAVASHGHYDHTGGFPAFCRINSKADIYIHKNAFRKSYALRKGTLTDVTAGIRWSDEELKEVSSRLIYTDSAEKINENIKITGTIKKEKNFEPTERFFYYDDDGELAEDDMSHEQCLAIREEEGIYIFSGCSHRGAVSSLDAGRSMFPGEKVAAFIAGMHLYNSDEQKRREVVDVICSKDIDKVIPVHCTGIDGICDFKNRLGDRCVAATAGYSFDGC
ncbi:MAG: MBL fold metallo-hydrolase [Anaerovoracaceae bacterium]